jgi:hypothetical protein
MHPASLGLAWGRGYKGSVALKRKGQSLIEMYTNGSIRFRPWKFAGAVGDRLAEEYRQSLEQLAPTAMALNYPVIHSAEAARLSPDLGTLIRGIIQKAESAS